MKFVVYQRVSTKGQGDSGLGLEAQQRDIQLYLDSYVYSDFEVIETVVDVKSGKGGLNQRSELLRAVKLCEEQGAVLLVAKLDRLSRDVELIAHLMNRKGFDFKVACMPSADAFQLHLYAALAQQEREFISQRTKAALKQAKESGVKLGGLRAGTNARNLAARQKANEQAEQYRAELSEMKKNGYSIRQMAYSLNERGIRASRGGEFSVSQVSRLLDRLGLKE